MTILLIFASFSLITIALLAIINVFVLPHLTPNLPSDETPFVSILIPARNEALVIGHTIEQLLKQSYQNFELIVLNDASTDRTEEIVSQFSQHDSRLTLVNGSPLPEGWMGKSWACHQLSKRANGQILLFTDADTIWHPHALQALVSHMQTTQADLFTVWSTQKTDTWSERLVVPLMAFVILGYLPILLTHYSRFVIFAAANGQCMAWKRNAYQKVGGHVAVANNVLDDVSLARLAKANGLVLRMADGNGYISCRMYDSWAGVRNGFAKNILAGYGNSILALLLATIFHLALFVAPLLGLFTDKFQVWSLLLIFISICTRALTATFSHQRVIDAMAMPISVLLMTAIAFQAMVWHFTGGPRWKGRTITAKEIAWSTNQSSSSAQGSAD